MERYRMLDIFVDSFESDEMRDVASKLLNDDKNNYIYLLSYWDLIRILFNSRLKNVIKKAALVVPATKGVSRIARFLLKTDIPCHGYFEFLIKFLGAIEELKGSLYILGDDSASLQKITQNIRISFPKLNIIGRCAGFYHPGSEKDIITAIKKSSPSVLLYERGIREKEYWAFRNRENCGSKIVVYAKNCFNILSGKKDKSSLSGFSRTMSAVFSVFYKPWRIFYIFIHLYFLFYLLFKKLRRH